MQSGQGDPSGGGGDDEPTGPPPSRLYDHPPEDLRRPERVALLEVDRAVDLSLAGTHAKSALDVGTGTGLFAEAFAARGLRAAGVDVQESMIEAARGLVPGVEFRVGSAEALPYEAAAFDVVFLGQVLHEASDLVLMLREARRVARDRVCVLEWPYVEQESGPPMHHRLAPEQIQDAARAAGYTRIEALPLQSMLFYRLR